MQLRGRELSWMLTALLLLICASAFPAQPERSKKFNLAIDGAWRASVLEQFSRQTGWQVMSKLRVAESKTDELGGFVGRATADEAMTALLEDTDISYEWHDEYTIKIFTQVIRPRAEDNLNEVLVTGTRLSEGHGPTPVRVYELENIERFGVSSVADFTRYLTQQPFSFSGGHLQSGAQFIQMRGLGVDTTLVLINGRRVPPSANSISLNAVDLNSLPVTAVDRIEVMSDSEHASLRVQLSAQS